MEKKISQDNSQELVYAGTSKETQCSCGGNCGCKSDSSHQCGCGGECNCQ